MCLSPVKVYNNKDGFDYRKDRRYNYVPCNHCPECLTNKRTDLMIRALCEQECFYTREDNRLVLHQTACSVFVTLTYDNDHLPYMMFPDGKLRPVFSRRHIQLFFKRMVKFYNKKGVRFHKMIACEYGSDREYFVRGRKRRATRRPHYHILLFFSSNISLPELRSFIQSNWTHCSWFINRSDGSVVETDMSKKMFGEKGDVYVDGSGACRYVSKYVTKFESSTQLFEDWLKSLNPETTLSDALKSFSKTGNMTQYLERLHKIQACKAAMPFFQTSMLFGQGIDHCTHVKPDYKNLKVHYWKDDINDYAVKTLPIYYKRKLFYQVTREDTGNSHRRIMFDDPIDWTKWHFYDVPILKTHSSFSAEYLKILSDRIQDVYKNLVVFYQGKTKNILHFEMSDEFMSKCTLTVDDFSFLDSLDASFYHDIVFYVLFNRGFETYLPSYYSISYAFDFRYFSPAISKQEFDEYGHEHFSGDLYVPGSDEVDKFERYLSILYDFNYFNGHLKNIEYQKEYRIQCARKSYFINLKKSSYV